MARRGWVGQGIMNGSASEPAKGNEFVSLLAESFHEIRVVL